MKAWKVGDGEIKTGESQQTRRTMTLDGTDV